MGERVNRRGRKTQEERDPHIEGLSTCPTCGQPVKVVTGSEGTSHYEPADPEHKSLAEAEARIRLLRRRSGPRAVEETLERMATEFEERAELSTITAVRSSLNMAALRLRQEARRGEYDAGN